ncbi:MULTISPECIES: PTS fructose-like transporter subunit IIB [unclassified Rathayibacter]|uniref:PTS fructose-like transporter subunit IIB n=1 Tax=unclassified Rathayibacter TaxID=2609250 RepID=UPI000CE8EB7B|nr:MULTISPECIES: PTS fructose-like transporter subunit IIB [unclassified Rathayibacter]PPF19858.1 PTS fructose transporter subunit IIBC [Rathayibacter sp. AY1A4]PPG82564.1 PTS fructose transporter subunit IIBC [Rathayibacter sp. AY1E5]PPH32479.1 PTS fructose transporter subunit IIBC [Rathayibacter sp. AY1C3]PPH60395.1 PTS fructose transporter subunit IIBC [Rathayibacter sp. AY1D7]PPI32248.1 PTS fructose transporter subunit IIBC [Rathayibacter sp. AY1B4]
MRIVAVTSCIAGIAHTYMAAEALEQAAKKKGYEIQVETQGAAGSDPMSDRTIADADVVILAADLEVRGKERFAGKPTLEVGTSEALAKAADVIDRAVAKVQDAPAASPASGPRFVAVTSCIAGIAHTYMAAEALEQAAKKRGYPIHVETQGAAGSDEMTAADIAAADVVILAADLEVRGKDRFAGKPILQVGVAEALSKPDEVLDRALALRGSAASAPARSTPAAAPAAPKKVGVGTRIRQNLMTGVSYMIPFVAAGGLLIALSFLFGGYRIVDFTAQQIIDDGFNVANITDWAGVMFLIGSATFAFLVPVLSGFIAFGIADRPGIAPGFLGGAVAVTVGAGFLGGLASGFIAGYAALYISRIKLPAAFKSLMPVVIIPLIATFITGFLMFVVLGAPLRALSEGLSSWLSGLSGGNLIILGIILGLMMAFDMGGPVNKVAYAFATTGLASVPADGDPNSVQFKVMAIVMAAGMTPPLGLALATTLRKRLFTDAERQNGKAAYLLGASFISEGAIPFAAVDPLRVIPSAMVGSAVTGALVALFGSTLRAPHGGVWVTGLVGQPILYLVAILVGMVVTAVCVIIAKSIKRAPVVAEVPEPATAQAVPA